MADSLAGPLRVNPALHRATDVGDEPLLLARLAPTIVARNRPAGADFAQFAGASVIVMDDGFQNPSLAKDLAILLSTAAAALAMATSCRPDRCGRRSGFSSSAPRLSSSSVRPTAPRRPARARGRRGIAIFHGHLEPDRDVVAAIGRRKVLAFAGIGDPEKFFSTLTEAGIEIAERVGFPDHHRYTRRRSARIDRAGAERQPHAGHHRKRSGPAVRRPAACNAQGARQRAAGAALDRRSGSVSANGACRRSKPVLGSALLLSRIFGCPAAATPPRAWHRLPAGRRSSSAVPRAGSAPRSPRSARTSPAAPRGNRRRDI